jgi:hypothetical protein
MPPQIRLHPSQVADLAEIRDTPPDTLTAIADHLQTANPRPMRAKELQQAITRALGGKSEAANRIMRPLLALQAIVRQRRLSADDVIEAVTRALETSDAEWSQQEIEQWRKVEPSFKNLLISPVVRLVSTALDLMYEHENLLQNARVVTDIRPVFSEDVHRVEGLVISHTLRLRYDSTEGDHSISVAMDEIDIQELKRQCERALLKAQTARTLMVERTNLPTVISGDGGNAEA